MKFKLLVIILMLLFTGFSATQNLGIASHQTLPSEIEPGDTDVILRVDVTHLGGNTYEGINITANFPSEFEVIKDTHSISKMSSQDTFTVSFKFNVNDDVEAGTYSIPIKFEYIDIAEDYTSYSRYIDLQVSGLPTLQLVDISGDIPYVGDKFTTKFVIQNTGLIPASNIETMVELDDDAVSWIPSSKIVNIIPESSIYDISFTGLISKNAEPGSYPGTLTLDYNGKTLTNDFILDVYGEPDLKIAGVSTDDDVYQGMKTSISLQLENVGMGDAESVKVVLQDDSYTGVTTSYIGTVEFDDTGTAIFDLVFKNKGTNNLRATITYFDELRNEHTFETYFDVYVNPMQRSYSWVVLLVIVAGGGYFYYRKKQQGKQLKKV